LTTPEPRFAAHGGETHISPELERRGKFLCRAYGALGHFWATNLGLLHPSQQAGRGPRFGLGWYITRFQRVTRLLALGTRVRGPWDDFCEGESENIGQRRHILAVRPFFPVEPIPRCCVERDLPRAFNPLDRVLPDWPWDFAQARVTRAFGPQGRFNDCAARSPVNCGDAIG
jgi:hypothetical protein